MRLVCLLHEAEEGEYFLVVAMIRIIVGICIEGMILVQLWWSINSRWGYEWQCGAMAWTPSTSTSHNTASNSDRLQLLHGGGCNCLTE